MERHHPQLPEPIMGKPWDGQQELISALAGLEDILRKKRGGSMRTYRGFSTCRLCGAHNGSSTFFYEGWEWPDGYMHYLVAHCVRPSLAFQEFVIGKEL